MDTFLNTHLVLDVTSVKALWHNYEKLIMKYQSRIFKDATGQGCDAYQIRLKRVNNN